MMVKKGKEPTRGSLRISMSPKLFKKKTKKKIETDTKPKGNKTLLIAQEVKFARLLSNNDKKVRDKVLKNLKKWLQSRSQSSFVFTETDFLRLWKGLFYCMWMSDKPLVQEDLAESLSRLVHCFNSKNSALLYTKCAFKSLSAEWFGIDRYRVDKFEMLVRKIIRQTFKVCQKHSWTVEWVVGVAKLFQDILLDSKSNLGLNLHITEVYMEELAKVSEGNIPKNMVSEFIRPFVIYLASASDQRQSRHIVKNIFRYLIFQSDVGMDYTEKFHAWRQAGFPCQSIDDVQKIEVLDTEDENTKVINKRNTENLKMKKKPLDPRAGRVDVEIPQIPFDPLEIAGILKQNKFHTSSTTKTRKHMTQLINDFLKLTEGNMPFGIKEITIPDKTKVSSYKSAEQLLKFEEELHSDSKKYGRKRKKKSDLYDSLNNTNTEKEILLFHTNKLEKDSTMNKKKKFNVGSSSQIEDSNVKSFKKVELNTQMVQVKEKLPDEFDIPESTLKNKTKKFSKKINENLTESSIKTNSNYAACSPNRDSFSVRRNIDSVILSPEEPNSNKKWSSIKKKNEITGKKKKYSSKNEDSNTSKSFIPWLTPVLTRLEEKSKTPSPKKSASKQTPTSELAKKRVKIMLQKNTAQYTSEYFRQIKMSPSIPFDAKKKPKAGVLKPSPLPSPANPFYKRKMC